MDDRGFHVRHALELASAKGWRVRQSTSPAHEACMSLQGVQDSPKDRWSVRLKAAEHLPTLDTFCFASDPSPHDGTFRLATWRDDGMGQPDELWAANVRTICQHRRKQSGLL
ncbi:hypothetical protein CYMTET_44227 [Cymbomonas tetramitiformis]|uniref:Uncharacterized protein n=1 Tax=Cymbomonas tetramitiformis TaxID=36881 RepID=A0AAE0EZV2_9CHLO|nr:hypothetical protein CYMTET_44227 [Cymbomonas tetramitiformis]